MTTILHSILVEYYRISSADEMHITLMKTSEYSG